MQPIRSSHIVIRTKEGENAWRTQALSPEQRQLLGSLRQDVPVSGLLRLLGWPPADLEDVLQRMAGSGWVLIQEQAAIEAEDSIPIDIDEPAPEQDIDHLRDLLARHQQQVEEREQSTIENPARQEDDLSPHPNGQDEAPFVPAEPEPPVVVSTDALPFDVRSAQEDGLLEALKNPGASAHVGEAPPEWAPPSGGLASLLRALGEEVPEDVHLSPDQTEHVGRLAPIEPWGSVPEPEARRRRDDSQPGLLRIPEQPEDEDEAPVRRAQLGALHQSLSQARQERMAADALRQRAREAREAREAEQRRINAERQQARQQEEAARQAGTLIGLSQKLAKVKGKKGRED